MHVIVILGDSMKDTNTVCKKLKFASTGIRYQDRLARSESLYRAIPAQEIRRYIMLKYLSYRASSHDILHHDCSTSDVVRTTSALFGPPAGNTKFNTRNE